MGLTSNVCAKRMARWWKENKGKYVGRGNVAACGRGDPGDFFLWPPCSLFLAVRYETNEILLPHYVD